MMDTTSDKDTVREVIESLIKAGTQFDINALERIYHNELRVLLLDQSGVLSHADKAGFMEMFAAKKAAGDPALNNWAQYNHIEASEDKAHVLITRKVKLGAEEQTLVLSIDLVHEDGRWQVTREVIFARPQDGADA